MSHSIQGKLVTADLWTEFDLNDWPKLREMCEAALDKSNMTVVKVTAHKFVPQGVTAVWILAESHMAVHTYPEEGFVAVDVFTCGNEGDPGAVIVELSKKLAVTHFVVNEAKRGDKMKAYG